ncbi:MAG: hypothetical protein U0518_03805 [Candidatus Gracilibacteria bacterium]
MDILHFLRQYHIFDYAIFDLTASFVGIYLLSPVLSRIMKWFRLDVPLQSWLLFTLPIGILVHIAVGSYTPMTRDLLDPSSHWILKGIILGCVVTGLKYVSIVRKL